MNDEQEKENICKSISSVNHNFQMEDDKSTSDIIADAVRIAPTKSKAMARDSVVYTIDFLRKRYGLKVVITSEYRRTDDGKYAMIPVLV